MTNKNATLAALALGTATTRRIPDMSPAARMARLRDRHEALATARATYEADGYTRIVGPARANQWGTWTRADTVVDHDPWRVYTSALVVADEGDASDIYVISGNYDDRCHHCRMASPHSGGAHRAEVAESVAFERRSAFKTIRGL